MFPKENKELLIKIIKKRIEAEYGKYNGTEVDWAEVAAKKIIAILFSEI